MINISYELWPIWTDWLEEQEQETALLKFCLEYGIWAPIDGIIIQYSYRFVFADTSSLLGSYNDDYGLEKEEMPRYGYDRYGNAEYSTVIAGNSVIGDGEYYA